MIFALDKRCRNLNHPRSSSYTLSDGLVQDLTHLKELVSLSALPISLTPAYSLTPREAEAKGVEKKRKAEYDAAIKRESSIVAESILHQWPDYRSVDFRELWFDKPDCHRRISEYIQSISRNIQLRNHVLKLQGILKRYEDLSMPTAMRHVFSPQFFTDNSKAPSYPLCSVLVSRPNVSTLSLDGEPFQGHAIPPTATTSAVPPPVGLDSLKAIIEELQRSRQPLLQLYGNDLNKSHYELLGEKVPQVDLDAVPSHEALLLYHKECCHRKDKTFAKIAAALAPSLNVEEISCTAGLWPRITPRSILRQLVQDRLDTLPNQWKFVITCYAISFLKYQQSLRMLELSSRQNSEDLLREVETIISNVLTESTPNWLLVQVRPFSLQETL